MTKAQQKELGKDVKKIVEELKEIPNRYSDLATGKVQDKTMPKVDEALKLLREVMEDLK